MLVVESANKLAKVLERVLRSKKYKKSFWKFSQEGCQLSTCQGDKKTSKKLTVFEKFAREPHQRFAEVRKMEGFVLMAVARVYVVEQANKLAEVLEHVLAVKKCKKSLRKLGQEGLQQQSQKMDDKKLQL